MGMDEIMKERVNTRNVPCWEALHIVEEHNGQRLQPFPKEEDRLERKEHSTKERLIIWIGYG